MLLQGSDGKLQLSSNVPTKLYQKFDVKLLQKTDKAL